MSRTTAKTLLVSPAEAASLLDVDRETVKRKLRAGDWPFYRLGQKSLKVDVNEILKLTRVKASGNR